METSPPLFFVIINEKYVYYSINWIFNHFLRPQPCHTEGGSRKKKALQKDIILGEISKLYFKFYKISETY